MTISYDDLVSAATVGITRKPLAMTGLGGPAAGYDSVLDAGDPAAALLDAAALLTVARRAGVQPRRGVTIPALPTDSAPVLSGRAVQALRELCQLGDGRWHRTARPEDAEFLASLLNAAAGAGYVASGSLLTQLLDALAKNPALGPAVTRLLGARGRLLVRFRQTWRDSVAAADAACDPEIWRTGSPAERLAYLSSLRDRDPAAARDLLAATWEQEHGRDRARFISVLSRNLSLADEEFLETALKDRAATVSAQVPKMLARLPDSAFARRAASPPGEWATALLTAASPFLSGVYSRSSEYQPSDALLSGVAAFPAPWPRDLADAVIAAFDREVAAVRERPPPWHRHIRQSAGALLRAAGRSMPATGDQDYAAELTRLAAASPFGQSEFGSAAATLNNRRVFLEEIS